MRARKQKKKARPKFPFRLSKDPEAGIRPAKNFPTRPRWRHRRTLDEEKNWKPYPASTHRYPPQGQAPQSIRSWLPHGALLRAARPPPRRRLLLALPHAAAPAYSTPPRLVGLPHAGKGAKQILPHTMVTEIQLIRLNSSIAWHDTYLLQSCWRQRHCIWRRPWLRIYIGGDGPVRSFLVPESDPRQRWRAHGELRGQNQG